ncbi:MAG: GIY-YIG nuclease family protein [Selenomonadaceae bacterium]|nr:GIY-YIG nuclease family protein [Selenomonadaceae bacterium]
MKDDNKKNADCQIVCFDVYVIWCKITNHFYVGVTRQKPVYTRIRKHKRDKQFIDREIQRTGWQNWDWWIVEKRAIMKDTAA